MVGDRTPILALQPLDDLADVFTELLLALPALLQRYKDYSDYKGFWGHQE